MYEFRAQLTSRPDRRNAAVAFANDLERLAKDGWFPVSTQHDYTPAYEGGQRQQYIWECILSREVPDAEQGSSMASD